VTGIVSTAVILRNRKPPPKPVTLAMPSALWIAAMRRKPDGWPSALPSARTSPPRSGRLRLYPGTLAAQAATEANHEERADAYRQAANYLRDRGNEGFRNTADRRPLPAGQVLCLFDRLDEALPVLEEALQQNKEHAARDPWAAH